MMQLSRTHETRLSKKNTIKSWVMPKPKVMGVKVLNIDTFRRSSQAELVHYTYPSTQTFWVYCLKFSRNLLLWLSAYRFFVFRQIAFVVRDFYINFLLIQNKSNSMLFFFKVEITKGYSKDGFAQDNTSLLFQKQDEIKKRKKKEHEEF